MTKAKQAAQEAAREHLRAMLPPGATVLCVLRSVARSGMSRQIDFYAAGEEPRCISGWIAAALDLRQATGGALKVGGCGMDMGFHVVSNLAARLYPDGFGCIGGDREARHFCPSNDHSNGDRDYTPHREEPAEGDTAKVVRHAHWHRSGDYALRHRWL